MTAALYIVIVAMLFQQAMSYMAAQVLPNVAPQVGEALRLNPELVFYHITLCYAVSGVFQASVGGLIIRWGAIRASQLSLLGLGIGLSISMIGTLWSFALAAIILGFSNSFSTPASSHLLARHSPKKYAPLIFSIKQTGVPVGGLFAVAAALLLVDAAQPETWTRAFMATGIICITLLVLIHPMRKEFDADRNPGYPVRFSDGLRNIGMVVRNPKLRDLAIAMYAFVGLQGLFNAIFTTYAQTSLGFEKDIALKILLAVNLISALSRILWGWVGSTVMSARLVLSLLAFIMAASSFAVGHAQGWPLEWVAFAAFAFGASALSWHGLLLSEVATLSPPGMVGPVTGGVLFWGALGMFTYPLFAKTLRDFGVSYEVIFSVAALPAIMIGIKLLWPAERSSKLDEAPTPLEAPTRRRANRIYGSINVVETSPLWQQPSLGAPAIRRKPGLATSLRLNRRRA